MPIKKLPFKSLESLVRRKLSTTENDQTRLTMSELALSRSKGYLTKNDLRTIAKWKSPRTIRHIESNSPSLVKSISTKAFRTKSERAKLSLLMELNGVSVPMASAILMFRNPKRYPVIDIRAWQVLHQMNAVSKNAGGTGFSFSHWYQYLRIVRHLASKHGVKARDIDRTLFLVHAEYQIGLLYRRKD